MSRHRYVKDYRLNEYIAENGRVTSESEYIGGDYCFAAGAARAKAAANRALALCALCWAGYLALVCVDGTAMRTVYVALPFAFTALPLFLLTRGAAGAALRRAAEARRGGQDRPRGARRRPLGHAAAGRGLSRLPHQLPGGGEGLGRSVPRRIGGDDGLRGRLLRHKARLLHGKAVTQR